MKLLVSVFAAFMAIGGVGLLTGCDHEVRREEKVKVNDDGTVKKQTDTKSIDDRGATVTKHEETETHR